MSRERPVLHVPLIAAALGVVSAAPPRLAAQQALRKGETVRVVSPPPAPGAAERSVRGRLVRLVNDTVILETGGGPHGLDLRAFDLHGATRLEIREGARSHTIRGGLIGALAGGLTLGAIAYATYRPCAGWFCDTRAEDTKFAAIVGGTVGAVVGAVIGSRRRGGHWVPVQTAGVRIALAPHRLALQLEL